MEIGKMKRPRAYQQEIVEFSAFEWTEKNASRYPDFIGKSESDRKWFAEKLARAARSSSAIDGSALASKLASAIHVEVDVELIEMMEDYASLHSRVHKDTVAKWLAAWGPARPFEDYARVEASSHKGPAQGIGLISERYLKTGEFLFRPDYARESGPDGYIGSWQVLEWEDVIRQMPLTPTDRETMTRHREAEAARETHYAASRLKQKARDALSSLIKANDGMSDDEAMSVYDEHARSPEKAARLIKALSMAAAAVLLHANPSVPSADAGQPAMLI